MNDADGSGEPSFVNIAICVGTDLHDGGVTLVNRLCMNEAAVNLINGDYQLCRQQEKVFAAMTDKYERQIAQYESNENILLYGFSFMAILVLCVSFALWKIGTK
jgi:hypothetical protein